MKKEKLKLRAWHRDCRLPSQPSISQLMGSIDIALEIYAKLLARKCDEITWEILGVDEKGLVSLLRRNSGSGSITGNFQMSLT